MNGTSDHLAQSRRELSTAQEALRTGNEGKARVCARRAAGQAITWYLSKHPHEEWGVDALRQLTHLKDDMSFPENVRGAAERLTTKISARFTSPFATNPIEDATIIIEAVIQLMGPDAH